MKPRTITRSALRKLAKEALNNDQNLGVLYPDSDAAKIDPVVDQSAADTDPMNPDHKPQNKNELVVALKRLSKDLRDDEAYKVYDAAKDAVEKSKEAELKKVGVKMDDKKHEALIRAQVRKMIAEAYEDLAYSGPEGPEDDEEEDGKKKKAGKYAGVSDVEGATFQEIADELGFSVSGAKKVADQAMQKYKTMWNLFETDELEITILVAMSDYIDMLASSGELSEEDVHLLKSNPDIVRELDGYREFLDDRIKEIQEEREEEE